MKRIFVLFVILSASLVLISCGGGSNVKATDVKAPVSSADFSKAIVGEWTKSAGAGTTYTMIFRNDNTWDWKSSGKMSTQMGGTYTMKGKEVTCYVQYEARVDVYTIESLTGDTLRLVRTGKAPTDNTYKRK